MAVYKFDVFDIVSSIGAGDSVKQIEALLKSFVEFNMMHSLSHFLNLSC